VRYRLRVVRYYLYWRKELSERAAVQQTAHRFEVSISTVRRWTTLYQQGGLEALVPKPIGPRNPVPLIPRDVQMIVVALRLLYGWNEKRIAQELKQRGLATISHTSVGRIFARYHLPTRTYHSSAKSDGIPKKRYEKACPNQQWHLDFTETTLSDGTRVVIIAIIDDHSRYCVRCQVVSDMTTETTLKVLQESCQEMGKPDEIVTDNGRTFTNICEDTVTKFEQHLDKQHIKHRLTTPYYPEGNGKAEALMKTLKRECLNQPFETVEALNSKLDEFVVYYNHFRLHSSLGYQTPVSRYLGIATFQGHGLAGLPELPAPLLTAYPPTCSIELPVVNIHTVGRRFALTLLNT
jgi:transposase InsO family protein